VNGLDPGVVVVTGGDEGQPTGMSCNSFTSVSLDPPLLLVCLDSLSQTRDAVVGSRAFNLSVLERAQEFLAERFSGRAPLVDPTWSEVRHRIGRNGLPIVEGCVAWFECELEDLHPAGDHEIAVGRVTTAGRSSGEPLILWDRTFWRVG
jgi:flavin reductase (DIM6/NTAB) family NADH-FMN oxidoreductase RutF